MPTPQEISRKTALESTETFATVLNTILTDKYGMDWLGWDGTTIYLELRDDYACDPSTETMDRINAVQVLMTTGEFFDRLEAFMNICNTFTSGTPAFNIFDPVTVAEASWGLAEASFMRELLPFAPSIRNYLKTSLVAEGLYDDYPDIVGKVLAGRPLDAATVRSEALETLHDSARADIDAFVNDQLEAMIYQFHQLGLQGQLLAMLKDGDRNLLPAG